MEGFFMSYNNETGMYEGYIYIIKNDFNDKVYIGQTTSSIKERWHGHRSAMLNEKRNKSYLYNAMRFYGIDKFHIEQLEKYEYQTKEELKNVLNEREIICIKQYKSLCTENGYNIQTGGEKNRKQVGHMVHQYDIQLNHIAKYESILDAQKKTGIDNASIGSCCSHRDMTAGGYIWAYDGEAPILPSYINDSTHYIDRNKFDTDNEWRSYLSLGYYGKIKQFDLYGNLIYEFDNIIDAANKLNTNIAVIKKNCNGKQLQIKNTVLRYEEDLFDKYELLHKPITMYDLNGNFVRNFDTKIEAERFLNAASGEIVRAIRRGGSCKGYLFSYYGEPLIRKTLQQIRSIDMCDKNWNVVKTFESKKDVYNYFSINDFHKSLNKAINTKTELNGYFWKYSDEFQVNL